VVSLRGSTPTDSEHDGHDEHIPEPPTME